MMPGKPGTMTRCPDCNGTGTMPDGKTCPGCDGDGMIIKPGT
jgi:DnaJ-class molecular chaperone